MPILWRMQHDVAHDALLSRCALLVAATMHDAADSDSETEAVQEAATVAGAGGAGFGAENDVPPAAEREVHMGPGAVHVMAQLISSHPWQVLMGPTSHVAAAKARVHSHNVFVVPSQVSVVSNASNGPEPAVTDDDASLVQGAAHSAFAGGGVPQQGASAVLVHILQLCLDMLLKSHCSAYPITCSGTLSNITCSGAQSLLDCFMLQDGAAAGAPGNSQAVAAEAAGGEIQSSGRPAAAGHPPLAPAASTLTSPASVPMQQPPPPAFDPPSAAAQLAGALSIAEPSTSAAADPTPIVAQVQFSSVLLSCRRRSVDLLMSFVVIWPRCSVCVAFPEPRQMQHT